TGEQAVALHSRSAVSKMSSMHHGVRNTWGRRARWTAVGLAVLAALGGAYAEFGTTHLFVRDASIDFRQVLALPNAPEALIVLPPGSDPRWESVRLRNVGTTALRFPRLVINDENRFGSYAEIAKVCSRTSENRVAQVYCFARILSRSLRRIIRPGSDGIGNFPSDWAPDALQALHYHGFTECGPSSSYLHAFANHLGLAACDITFGKHVVLEIADGERRSLIDLAGMLFYTEDYTSVASLADVRRGGALASAPGKPGFRSSRDVLYNREQFLLPPTMDCAPPPAPRLPLADFCLRPGEEIEFETGRLDDLNGRVVVWYTHIEGKAMVSLALPYPGISVAVTSSDGKDLPVRILTPLPAELLAGPVPVTADLTTDVPARSRVFSMTIDLPEERGAELAIRMRYASAALPRPVEGINTIVLSGEPDGGGEAVVEVSAKMRVRRNERLTTDPVP
ncbi:hypothetical protein K8I61_16360, partial [bacterium]|nr:hypothetical protein [bacterium]